jgi:transposase-like protein
VAEVSVVAKTPRPSLVNQRQEGVRLYRDTQLTVETIAQRVGVSRATMYNWLKQEGVRRGGRTSMADITFDEVRDERWERQLHILNQLTTDVAAMRKDIGDLRTEVARLVGALEAMTRKGGGNPASTT